MANLQFWRSREKSDTSFLDLIKRTFGKTFTTGLEAKTWLTTNGYYTSYPDIVTDGLVLSLDASNSSSFKGEPTSNLLNTDYGLDCTFENRNSHYPFRYGTKYIKFLILRNYNHQADTDSIWLLDNILLTNTKRIY